MKRSKLLFAAMFVCAIAGSSWSAVLTDDSNTIALWHMDTITPQGSPARNYILDDDSAPPVNWRNHDLLLGWTTADANFEPTVVAGQAGYGNCLSFDGINDAAYLNGGWAGYQSVKVDFWVKPGANAYRSNDPNVEYIVRGGPWWVCIDPNATTPQFTATAYSTGCWPYFPNKVTLPAQVGVWQHVILSVSNSTMTLTVDGTSASSTLYYAGLDTTVTDNICVGNYVSIFGAKANAFQGLIDEVKITSANVPKLDFVQPFTDQTTTKALWHFDSVSPTTYQFMDDHSMHATRASNLDRYNGTTKDTDTTSVPTAVDPGTFIPPYGETAAVGYPAGNSAFGNCVYFDGISDRCQIANTALPALDGNNLTIQGWIRPDEKMTKYSGTADYYWRIWERWGQVMIYLRQYNTSQHMNLQVYAYDKLGGYKVLSYDFDAKGVDWHKWMHVKFTCIGNACTLYLNGASVSTATLANAAGVTGLGNPTQTTMVIGSRYNRADTFWGFMDEFRIDSTAHCGDLGYSVGDFDQNCMVDFNDVKVVALGWLYANPYSGNSGSANYPAPVEQKWADTGNFNIPKTTNPPTIDGTFHASEWADARTVEMVCPTLNTSPNIGYVDTRNGLTVPTGSDFSLYWYLKWDNNYLYVAGVVYDNDVNPAAGKDEPQIGFNYLNVTGHTYLTQAYLWNFKSDNTWNTNTGPAPSSDTMFVRVNNPAGLAGYVIEAKLKWSDIACDNSAYVPAVGDKHGLMFYCVDHDLTGTQTHGLMSYPDFRASVLSEWNTITLVNTIDCHEKLQSVADLNSDCKVDFKDFATLAANWLACTDPSGAKCHN